MRIAPVALVAILLLGPYTPPASAAQENPNGRAASPAPPSVRWLEARSLTVTAAPRIDGRLDDAAWADAPVAADFVQRHPHAGSPSRRRTEARVIHDRDAIYVAMRMWDDPDSITAQLGRRDAGGLVSDWAHVVIDGYHDRRTAYRFSVTPRGTQKDVLHYDDTAEDVNWDAVWEAATRIDDDGWTAEFRIPLSQLRFAGSDPDGDGAVWGINFGREIARLGESAWWSPVPPNAGAFVSLAGELRGIRGLESPRRLELTPYSTGRLTRAPDSPGNPFHSVNSPSTSAGVDVRYGLSSNLTLSATLNPDFGQVEADPSVVNLSAFETFFPEKRPFFVEGSNLFDFSISVSDDSPEGLFYTRRIGRAPQRAIDVPDGFVDRPEATRILGAAKLTGRTGSGWTLAGLTAVTAREDARVALPGGDMESERIEPLTAYSVAVLGRDFGRGRTRVSGIATAMHRRLGDGDELDFLTRSAYGAAARVQHRFAADRWQLYALAAGSHVLGSEDAIRRLQAAPARYFQRPDADHVAYDPERRSLTGAAAHAWLSKTGGSDPWRGGLGGHLRTPGLELNDLGFQSRADQAMVFANLRYHRFEQGRFFRNWFVGINPNSGWTTGGERLWTQLNAFGRFELNNFWSGGAHASFRADGRSADALRGGPMIRRPASRGFGADLATDRRRPVHAVMAGNASIESESGGRFYSLRPTLGVRPSGRLGLSLGTRFDRDRQPWQYVTRVEAGGRTRYVFAELDRTTFALTGRLNLAVSRDLTLDLYVQPYISGGEYSAFKEVADPMARAFGDRFRHFPDTAIRYDAGSGRYHVDADDDGAYAVRFANPDFNFRQMRGNAVLRWEYRPGSTLFLVWSQSRTGSLAVDPADPAFDFGRDVRRLFNRDDGAPTPLTNVFAIKLSYWLDR